MGGGVFGQHSFAGALADGATLGLVRVAQQPRDVSSDDRATRISRPGRKIESSPSHQSLMIGVPQAAASKSRTLGDHPARIMSARVTLSVNRWAL